MAGSVAKAPELHGPLRREGDRTYFAELRFRDQVFVAGDCVAMLSRSGTKRQEFVGVVLSLFEDPEGMWFTTRWLEPVARLSVVARFRPEDFGEGEVEAFPQPVECISRRIFDRATYARLIKGVTCEQRRAQLPGLDSVLKRPRPAAASPNATAGLPAPPDSVSSTAPSPSSEGLEAAAGAKRARWGAGARGRPGTLGTSSGRGGSRVTQVPHRAPAASARAAGASPKLPGVTVGRRGHARGPPVPEARGAGLGGEGGDVGGILVDGFFIEEVCGACSDATDDDADDADGGGDSRDGVDHQGAAERGDPGESGGGVACRDGAEPDQTCELGARPVGGSDSTVAP